MRRGPPASYGRIEAAAGVARREDIMVAALDAKPRDRVPVLDAVADLAPGIAVRAGEIEAARRLPPDLLDDLRDGRMLPDAAAAKPRRRRGRSRDRHVRPRGAGPGRRLGGVDRGHRGAGWLDLCGLPRPTFDALYADGPIVTAGVFAPQGTAEAVDGGYRVRGRWGFASGCEHAELLFGNCIDLASPPADGPPPMRIALFSPDQVDDRGHLGRLGPVRHRQPPHRRRRRGGPGRPDGSR